MRTEATNVVITCDCGCGTTLYGHPVMDFMYIKDWVQLGGPFGLGVARHFASTEHLRKQLEKEAKDASKDGVG